MLLIRHKCLMHPDWYPVNMSGRWFGLRTIVSHFAFTYCSPDPLALFTENQ